LGGLTGNANRIVRLPFGNGIGHNRDFLDFLSNISGIGISFALYNGVQMSRADFSLAQWMMAFENARAAHGSNAFWILVVKMEAFNTGRSSVTGCNDPKRGIRAR
jgi:hypothetical protein